MSEMQWEAISAAAKVALIYLPKTREPLKRLVAFLRRLGRRIWGRKPRPAASPNVVSTGETIRPEDHRAHPDKHSRVVTEFRMELCCTVSKPREDLP